MSQSTPARFSRKFFTSWANIGAKSICEEPTLDWQSLRTLVASFQSNRVAAADRQRVSSNISQCLLTSCFQLFRVAGADRESLGIPAASVSRDGSLQRQRSINDGTLEGLGVRDARGELPVHHWCLIVCLSLLFCVTVSVSLCLCHSLFPLVSLSLCLYWREFV